MGLEVFVKGSSLGTGRPHCGRQQAEKLEWAEEMKQNSRDWKSRDDIRHVCLTGAPRYYE